MHYTTETNAAGGVRFDVLNPPEGGARLTLHDGRVVTFDGMGFAGMLACTDDRGSQQLYFPGQIQGVAAAREGAPS